MSNRTGQAGRRKNLQENHIGDDEASKHGRLGYSLSQSRERERGPVISDAFIGFRISLQTAPHLCLGFTSPTLPPGLRKRTCVFVELLARTHVLPEATSEMPWGSAKGAFLRRR